MLRHSSRALRRSGRKLLNALLSDTRLRSHEVVEEAIRRQYRLSLRREVNPGELKSWIDLIYEEGLARIMHQGDGVDHGGRWRAASFRPA